MRNRISNRFLANHAIVFLIMLLALVSFSGCASNGALESGEAEPMEPAAGNDEPSSHDVLESVEDSRSEIDEASVTWAFVRSEADKYLGKSLEELLSMEHDWVYAWRGDGLETLHYESGYQAFLFSGPFWDDGSHSAAVSESLAYLLGLRNGEAVTIEMMIRKLGDDYIWIPEKSCYEYHAPDLSIRIYVDEARGGIVQEKPNALLFTADPESLRGSLDVENGASNTSHGANATWASLGWDTVGELAGMLGMPYEEFVEAKGKEGFAENDSVNANKSLREVGTDIIYNFGEMRVGNGETDEVCASISLPARRALDDSHGESALRDVLMERGVDFIISKYDRLDYVICFEDSTEIFIPCDAGGELLLDGMALLKKA